ncbi:MAG: YidC/Oxa1 family insertase periplasmic-domain containing protein [Candidatus Omnitrophica bacterium]|nr:YidC/Oxa1 family insertase periplasmic-domain containing protein [Candidatus Omnitrophota bacterium]
MEKRLVLSFILSFLILYTWASLAPKPVKNPPLLNSQLVEGAKEPSQIEDPKNEPEASQESISKEKIYTLEAQGFVLNFSDVGGSINKISFNGYDLNMPLTNISTFEEYDEAIFDLIEQNESSIEFISRVKDIEIRKKFIVNDNHTISVENAIKNESSVTKTLPVLFKGFTLNMNRLDNSKVKADHDQSLFEYVLSTNSGIKRKNNAFKFNPKESVEKNELVNWIGYRNRYYCAIAKPNFISSGYTVRVVDEMRLDIIVHSSDNQFKPNEEKQFNFTYYFGPEKTEFLSTYKAGFESIKRYYKFWLFDSIAKFIDWIMKILHKVIPNWGISIILISILIYYGTYPLTARGMSSMKKMQALQPKIQVLKEKYEKNPQKLNQEMLELYRREKINPVGGCFPILLQMPIFIGLYQVLWRNVDFKGASFLWIKDLSHADRLFVLNHNFPVIGNEINLLPILMMVIMYFQQKFSSKNMVLSDPMQIQQQKMIAVIMPFFLGFIFYKFASGLTLYFTMFYIFSTVTQWKLSKEPKK